MLYGLRGIHSDNLSLEVVGAELIQTQLIRNQTVKMNCNRHYKVYIRNNNNAPYTCKLVIDDTLMGLFEMEAKSGYTIERPVDQDKQFFFRVDNPKSDDVQSCVVKATFLKHMTFAEKRDKLAQIARMKKLQQANVGRSRYNAYQDKTPTEPEPVDTSFPDYDANDVAVMGKTVLEGKSEQTFLGTNAVYLDDSSALTLQINLIPNVQ